jgi:ATP-dependent RNA helicase DDX19/DBP5
LGPAERNAIVQEYREGKASVLITSNVLARGVDIPATDFVVNLDIPVHYNSGGKLDAEMYTHRIGRAGRFGRNGIAISLVEGRDLQRIRELEAALSTGAFQLRITELDPNGKEGPEGMKKQVEADLKKKK